MFDSYIFYSTIRVFYQTDGDTIYVGVTSSLYNFSYFLLRVFVDENTYYLFEVSLTTARESKSTCTEQIVIWAEADKKLCERRHQIFGTP